MAKIRRWGPLRRKAHEENKKEGNSPIKRGAMVVMIARDPALSYHNFEWLQPGIVGAAVKREGADWWVRFDSRGEVICISRSLLRLAPSELCAKIALTT